VTIAQFANSQYAYIAFTFAVAVVGKRVVSVRTADLLTALSIGLWMGTVGSFWRGVATIAVTSTTLLALSFLVGLAIGLWRVRHQIATRWRGRSE
jgi:non-ribosomal peptide synthetase component F